MEFNGVVPHSTKISSILCAYFCHYYIQIAQLRVGIARDEGRH